MNLWARPITQGRVWSCAAWVVASALVAPWPGFAQEVGPAEASEEAPPPTPGAEPVESESRLAPLPDLSEAVATLLQQDYLNPLQRAELRVRHGVWEEGDLASARLAGMAALARGAFGDRALTDSNADPLDRAEALLRTGDPAGAIAMTGEATDLRAARIRIEAMLDLGKRDESLAQARAVMERLRAAPIKDAEQLAEAVRALLVLARLQGAEGRGVVGYQEMLSILGRAREELDPLSPNVELAEALLLYEKDNYQEAGESLESALLLHPRLAEAWYLLGRLHADTFSFAQAEVVANRLDQLAGQSSSDEGSSVYGSMVRAAIRLKQIEGAAAETSLDEVLGAYPDQREARALEVAAAATAFDFERAETLLKEFDELAPGSPAAYLATGKALAGARQYEDAARMLRAASERAPLWAEPLVELGLSELQAGRIKESREALEKGLLLDRFNMRAANSRELLKELAGYASVESEHFVVRYKPGVDEVMAGEMLDPLERIYQRVTGNGPGGIDHAPAAQTVVELYPNHRWFATRITGLPKLHTFAAATGPVIAMEAPRVGPGHTAGSYDWMRVVQHEFTHTVTLSRTRNRLPHWFTEASAMYLEDAPKDWNVVRLLTQAYENDALFDFETINLMFVRPRRATDRSLAYAQGAWMYEYILERFGQSAPLQLMDVYASGAREPEAFKQVLGLTREQFLEEFKEWAGERLREWGMVERPGMTPLAQLIEDSGESEPTPRAVARWLEEQPDNPFVLSYALERFRQAQAEPPTDRERELLLAYAAARPVDPLPHKILAKYLLSQAGQEDLAVEHLLWLDTREQSAPGYAVELARRYAAQGKWDEAIAKATRATGIAPYDGTIREFAASIALRARRPQEAERHILALTRLEPDRAVHKQRLEAVRKMIEAGGK